MNCSEVQEKLSGYFDGELAKEDVAVIDVHLARCSECSEELAFFRQLSDLSSSLTNVGAALPQWSDLEKKLDVEEHLRPLPSSPPRHNQRLFLRLFAVAAALVIVVGLSVTVHQIWFSADEHNQLSTFFEQYVDAFDRNPEEAQQILVANFNGRQMTVPEASAKLKYAPVIARGLPSGCSLKAVYLLDMPCCTCAQAVCNCGDGQHVAVFEHDLDESNWFGDRPAINCLCEGVPTTIVQINGQLAATWKHGNRLITVIGVRDVSEVTRFVVHLTGPNPTS